MISGKPPSIKAETPISVGKYFQFAAVAINIYDIKKNLDAQLRTKNRTDVRFCIDFNRTQ